MYLSHKHTMRLFLGTMIVIVVIYALYGSPRAAHAVGQTVEFPDGSSVTFLQNVNINDGWLPSHIKTASEEMRYILFNLLLVYHNYNWGFLRSKTNSQGNLLLVDCVNGYGATASYGSPSPTPIPTPTPRGFVAPSPTPIPRLDIDLVVTPSLVRQGSKVRVTWSSEDATSCTVTGNGDTWTGTSGTRESTKPIEHTILYALTCTDGFSNASHSVPVHVVPVYKHE